MSCNKRSTRYCHKTGEWKMVEANSREAQNYRSQTSGCQTRSCCEPCRVNCCKEQAACKKRCPSETFPRTDISVKNPTSVLEIPEEVTTRQLAPLAFTGVAVDLAGWTDIIIDVLDSFDNATGTYTAPEAGDYEVSLIVNYRTSVPLPVNVILNNIPTIQIYDVNDPDERILASIFPTFNDVVVVPPPTTGDPPVEVPVTVINYQSQIIIDAIIPLNFGQQIRARAVTNGLTYNPPMVIPPPPPAEIIFDPEGVDTTFSIKKVRNTPIVTII